MKFKLTKGRPIIENIDEKSRVVLIINNEFTESEKRIIKKVKK